MGGNALKITKNRRYNYKEYYSTVHRILTLLHKSFPNLLIEDVKAYRTKETFGDIDILVEKTESSRNEVLAAFKEWCVTEFVPNGDVVSLGWEDIQVDLVFHRKETFDFALHYFNYNDLGNLLGRVAYNLGFKLGFDGLKYVVRDGDNKLGEVVLTTDFKAAVMFLGYDYTPISEGFDDLEDIFKFVSGGFYFRSEYYTLAARPHRARTRDVKRKTYMDFLEWLEKNPTVSDRMYTVFKGSMFQFASITFPHFAQEVFELRKENRERQYIKNKFNGDVVRGLTGLEGKDLGMFMQYLRGVPEFNNDKLLYATPCTIAANVIKTFNKYIDEGLAE